MKDYTVTLMRPDYLSEEMYSSYVALVSADSINEAIRLAREELTSCDADDDIEVEDPDDYALLFVQEGHHLPVRWGWQL